MLKNTVLLVVGAILGGIIMFTQDVSAHDPHNVASGDTCWDIAESHMGSGFDYPDLYAQNADLIEEVAQARGLASSDFCHWIFPGTVFGIPSSGTSGAGGNDDGVNPGNSEGTGGADGEGNEDTNGSGNGVVANPDPKVFVCDGRLIDSEQGFACMTAEPNGDLMVALVGLLGDERGEDDFPVWAIVLFSLLGAFFGLVVLLLLAWALFHDHHHRTPTYPYPFPLLTLLLGIMFFRRRRIGRFLRRPGTGPGGSTGSDGDGDSGGSGGKPVPPNPNVGKRGDG